MGCHSDGPKLVITVWSKQCATPEHLWLQVWQVWQHTAIRSHIHLPQSPHIHNVILTHNTHRNNKHQLDTHAVNYQHISAMQFQHIWEFSYSTIYHLLNFLL